MAAAAGMASSPAPIVPRRGGAVGLLLLLPCCFMLLLLNVLLLLLLLLQVVRMGHMVRRRRVVLLLLRMGVHRVLPRVAGENLWVGGHGLHAGATWEHGHDHGHRRRRRAAVHGAAIGLHVGLLLLRQEGIWRRHHSEVGLPRDWLLLLLLPHDARSGRVPTLLRLEPLRTASSALRVLRLASIVARFSSVPSPASCSCPAMGLACRFIGGHRGRLPVLCDSLRRSL